MFDIIIIKNKELKMPLIKRNNIYHYKIQVNGKKYTGTTKQTNKSEAEAFEKKIKKHLKEKKSPVKIISNIKKSLVRETLKLENLWTAFEYNLSSCSIRYIQQYKSRVDKLVDYMLKNGLTYLHEIDKNNINSFLKYIKLNSLATRTVKDTIFMYSQIFNFCQKNEYVFDNFFSDIKIKGLKKDTIHKEAFTPEELKNIGEHSKDTYLYPLFITGIFTGLREGDICNLKWSNVDLEKRQIITKMSKTSELVYIPILAGLYNYLITLQKNEVYVYPKLHNLYNKRQPQISSDVSKFLNRIGIETSIKIKGRTKLTSIKDIHSLRHTFAYMSAIHNIPFTIVQSILGHMDSNMTKMYMNHSTMEAKKNALATMPNYLHPDKLIAIDKSVDVKKELLNMNQDNWESIRDRILKG
jgi:integrase